MDKNVMAIRSGIQWKTLYLIGGIAALLWAGGTVFDIVFGSIASGELAAIPQTAEGRFAELNATPLLGLYHFDLLNVAASLFSIVLYAALLGVHRNVNLPYAFPAFTIALIGTVVFVTTNSGLAMLELSRKYYAATDEAVRLRLVSAGEALLVRGEHGSLGVFPGFFLCSVGGLATALVVANGKVFGRFIAWSGVLSQALLLVYVILIALFPSLMNIAVALAAPGGILALVWILLLGIRLVKMGRAPGED
jgi:hypothetical protein